MRSVNTSIRKKDAMALVTGKPVYTDDIAAKDALIVKILRSPHAFAIIKEIDTAKAEKLDGIACVLTYKDVPNTRFTLAGQTYPETSPYDRLVLENIVRFVGDSVAIVAGETEEIVDRALKLIKVQYEVKEPILNLREAKDSDIVIHPEENWKSFYEFGGDPKKNLCASGVESGGDMEKALAESDLVLERTYHTKANQQTMMETFRAYSYMDVHGRLTVVSSTQVPFHVRRIVANALEIPKSQVRVIKPRIGGGFGAKQTAVCEVYPAIVTQKTGRSAKIIFSRYESQIASSPRHEMEITVKIGMKKDGEIKAINVYTLSNTGAYGEHSTVTVGLSGHKSIPLYSRIDAFNFGYDVVYTNMMSAGAYRGFGATQGIFAVESCIDEICHKLKLDPVEVREKNLTKEGDLMPAYYNEYANSCALDRCLERAKQMMDWKHEEPRYVTESGKIRAIGTAMAMQGSSIAGVDVASVAIKLNDDGFYTLMLGATDMGTGCDTILAQIAAECLGCSADNIIVQGVDTDTSPYDSGSYASSTTYLTGMATVKTCEALITKIKKFAADKFSLDPEELDFEGDRLKSMTDEREILISDLANDAMFYNDNALYASESHRSPISPPPFMVGMVEIELDPDTGKVDILRYKAAVDCGTPINPNLARVQTEGGIAQGIGMALFEDVIYDKYGRCQTNSFMQYKIPTRLDVGEIDVAFESSYEQSGPFGAKSIGEIVINTPSPAIANAVENAVGVRIRELPITAEKIKLAMLAK